MYWNCCPVKSIGQGELGRQIRVSRVAIWRQIERLKKTGVDIISVSGQGYKILAEFEMLDAVKIYKNLANAGGINSSSIRVSKVVDSTNAVLMRLPPSREQKVVFSEYQTAGRGRREEGWISPPGGGIWFSSRDALTIPHPVFRR